MTDGQGVLFSRPEAMPKPHGTGRFLSGGFTALGRTIVLSWTATAALLLSLAAWIVVPLLGCGIGLLLLPALVGRIRRLADHRRRLAKEWSGVEIPVHYAPPPPREPGFHGILARCRWIVTDSQTWRDQLWVSADPIAGAALAGVPAALFLGGLWGVGLAFYGVRLDAMWGGVWFLFVPVNNQALAFLAGLLGAAMLPLALWTAPRVVTLHAKYTRALLAPSEREQMTHRIKHLARTRADAEDSRSAEIRRIERDLHDGAQARLVAMGMTLNAAEHRLESDPEAVRELLREARQSSVKALEELRDLVRGIHPPILADRGLADAVRSLAMLSPLRTEVVIDLPDRPEPPIESAVYFAVSELLTNAAKHSGAEHVEVALRGGDGMLRVTITDDGEGGADASLGSGLRGVERRIATFDGVMTVSSPVNGPTTVILELPCGSSSPKTSSC